MRRSILERYPRNNEGMVVIEIAAGMVEDIYNHFDRYTPYVKKDLDQDFVDYLLTAAQEIGKEPFIIHFHFTLLCFLTWCIKSSQPPRQPLPSSSPPSQPHSSFFSILHFLSLRLIFLELHKSS